MYFYKTNRKHMKTHRHSMKNTSLLLSTNHNRGNKNSGYYFWIGNEFYNLFTSPTQK